MFIFTVCQAGAESALKRELGRAHPELRPAYSRPGFVTFKVAEGKAPGPDLELKSVLAREYGLSIGKSPGIPEPVLEAASRFRAASGRAVHLRVFERDRHEPGSEPPGFDPFAEADRAEARIREAAREPGVLAARGSAPGPGDPVLDVCLVEPDEWWLGEHLHHTGSHFAEAGGRTRLSLPAEAPSRAFLKVEEAIRWLSLPMREGDVAVEIGSAPGGASFALLERGVSVTGIDPGEMAPQVLKYGKKGARFTHLRAPVAGVPRAELPERAQWLLADMNVLPGVTLSATTQVAGWLEQDLVGVILTLKLNDWNLVDEIPEMLERVRAMGMARVRARQLSTNRREFCAIGLTRRGLARMRG